MNNNKVFFKGRLTHDPDLRKSISGNSVLKFSLANSKTYKKDADSGTNFVDFVAFGKNAEFIADYFEKGSMVEVWGRLDTSTYEKDDGSKIKMTKVVVEEAGFGDSKQDSDKRAGGLENEINQVDHLIEDHSISEDDGLPL